MTLDVALRLGRVSNLPTVWTNVLCGLVLAGGSVDPKSWWLLSFGCSLLYVGGMFLNDAFDADVDAVERPERPIPRGEVGRATVIRIGFGLLVAGVATVVSFGRPAALLVALALAGAIVVYDRWHKGNPAAPVVMGACRAGVVLLAGFASVAHPHPALFAGAALLAGYTVSLTHVARFETRDRMASWWPLLGLLAPLGYALIAGSGGLVLRGIMSGLGLWIYRAIELARRGGPSIGAAVGSLIAGISLLDALLIAVAGRPLLALLAVVGFGLTIAGQRRVAGT